jgi:hypothetical protein
MLGLHQFQKGTAIGRRLIQRQDCCDFLLQDGIHFALGVLSQPIRKFLQLCEDLLDPIISIDDPLARLGEIQSKTGRWSRGALTRIR